MATSLGALLAGGVAAALVVSWLTSRRSFSARFLGRVIAAAVTILCAFLVFTLIADNGIDSDLRVGGSLAILDFALIAGLVIWAAVRSRSTLRNA